MSATLIQIKKTSTFSTETPLVTLFFSPVRDKVSKFSGALLNDSTRYQSGVNLALMQDYQSENFKNEEGMFRAEKAYKHLVENTPLGEVYESIVCYDISVHDASEGVYDAVTLKNGNVMSNFAIALEGNGREADALRIAKNNLLKGVRTKTLVPVVNVKEEEDDE